VRQGTGIGQGVGLATGFFTGAGTRLLSDVIQGRDINYGEAAAYGIAGAAVGYAWGTNWGRRWGERVARKKADYGTSERFLLANIKDAQQLRKAAESKNAQLAREIENSRKLNPQQMNAQQRSQFKVKLNQERAQVQNGIQRIDQEITAQRVVLRQERTNTQIQQERSVLSSEIARLEAEKQKLQQASRELSAIGNRFAG